MKKEQLKMRSYVCRFFALMLLSFSALSINARTIHWITFINTDDPHVGAMDQNARKTLYGNLIGIVNSETSQYGYDYKIYDYYSGSFNSVECKVCLDNLKCDSTDIVVFYFIGHGTRISNDNTRFKYPHLLFDDKYENCIPLSWIHQAIKNKGARLTLTFAVCDNSYQGADCHPKINDVVLPAINRLDTNPSLDGHNASPIVETFLCYEGDLIVCSAAPGQHTWGMQTDLGPMDLFTRSIVSFFEAKTPNDIINWPDMLDSISAYITDVTKTSFSSIQTPTYDYNLKQIQVPKRNNYR